MPSPGRLSCWRPSLREIISIFNYYIFLDVSPRGKVYLIQSLNHTCTSLPMPDWQEKLLGISFRGTHPYFSIYLQIILGLIYKQYILFHTCPQEGRYIQCGYWAILVPVCQHLAGRRSYWDIFSQYLSPRPSATTGEIDAAQVLTFFLGSHTPHSGIF